MVEGLFRVRLDDDTIRLAAGPPDAGPRRWLGADLTIAAILRDGATGLADALAAPADDAVDQARVAAILAPVDDQEVWAAGVTYRRSRDARKDESSVADVYDLVYEAERPELFFKAPGWRVVGPDDAIGVRTDSAWDVPEPELGLVVSPDGWIAGWVIGNDVSSRDDRGREPAVPAAGQGLRPVLRPRPVPRPASGARSIRSTSISGSNAAARRCSRVRPRPAPSSGASTTSPPRCSTPWPSLPARSS